MKNRFTLIIIFLILILGLGLGYFLSQQETKMNSPIFKSEKSENTVFNKFGGGTIDLKDYIGKKPVVLDFWASWCPNCQRSMPVLNQLYLKYKDKVEVIGINIQEPENLIKKFVESYKINFPIVFDFDGEISREYGINYTNVHVLVGIDGKVIKVIPGDIAEADIKSLL